ncbi:MAG: LytTR family transcriptional regulator DNA-binding domain-containing protein [Lachnospiraceae bacterium]|nr:LytTR family transcriptional regulator DNA-binding domain-containing protein [Lachnospiraceae bacterium]
MEDRVYRIAVCDDETKDIDIIIDMIRECYPGKQFLFDTYTETETVIEAMKEKEYELLILDLQFADDDSKGISVLDYVERTGYGGYVIFITKLKEYSKAARGKNVLWLINKKPQKDDVVRGMDKFFHQVDAGETLSLENGNSFLIKDIVLFESINKNTFLELVGGKRVIADSSITTWEEKLSEYDFVRVNRGLLINMDYIEAVNNIRRWGTTYLNIVIKFSGREICIPKDRRKTVENAYHDFRIKCAVKR